jgi:hypothetical protein
VYRQQKMNMYAARTTIGGIIFHGTRDARWRDKPGTSRDGATVEEKKKKPDSNDAVDWTPPGGTRRYLLRTLLDAHQIHFN